LKNFPFSRVLSVYPYERELKSYGFFPPIGLEHISSAVKEYVKEIAILDRRFEKETSPFLVGVDLILVSINWWHEEESIKKWIASLPPDVLTIVGGRYATENSEEYLQECPNIDIIVRGDGEETIREIVAGKAFDEVAGISYRNNGKITHNRTRSLSVVSDSIYPDRSLRRYRYNVLINGIDSGLEIDSISGSRGCPFNCKYCDFDANPLGQKREWSGRNPESVIREIESISAGHIFFTDDNFTFDQKRVDKICDLLIKRKIKKNFIINTRLNIAKNSALLEKMYRAGFRILFIGIESTQDRTLKSMQKGFTTRNVREWSHLLKRFNFFFHGYFIIGNIDEGYSDMIQIPSFARENGIDTLGLSTLRARKFSPLHELIKERPEYKIDENDKVYSNSLSTDRLNEIRKEITRNFYVNLFQIGRIMRKLIGLRILTLRTITRLMVLGGLNLIRK